MSGGPDSSLENGAHEGPWLESAAADNELVKFDHKVTIDVYSQVVPGIPIAPVLEKTKTGIRARVDGTLQAYIEVRAQFLRVMLPHLKIICGLGLSEKREPQDGKIKFKKYGPLEIELSVVTTSSAGGGCGPGNAHFGSG